MPIENELDLQALLRPEHIHASVYTSDAVFRLEMQRLFARSWTLLGHECQLPKAGDYFLSWLAAERVIVCRDREGAVQVLVNRCAHRGAAVCSEPTGNRQRFVCPYHAWSYELDGRLAGIPLKEDYPAGFDTAAHGLPRVAAVERYRGFIFASLDPRGVSLRDFLGAAHRAFDDIVDRSPSGRLLAPGAAVRYRIRANWKMVFENLNDLLHPLFAHASAGQAVRAAEGLDRESLHPLMALLAGTPPPTVFRAMQALATPWGHSFIEGVVGAAGRPIPRDTYFEALAQRHGEARAEEVLRTDLHLTLLYPCATINSRNQAVRIVRPISPRETEVHAYLYGLEGAPHHVYQEALEYSRISSSPSSTVVVDDFEIYERCQAQHEANAERWVSMGRGAGEAPTQLPDGSWRNGGTSEAYIRNQYRVWARRLAEA